MNIKTLLENDNIVLNESFFKLVQRYKEHLIKWNKVHNLTGAKTEKMIDDFIYDAVYPIVFLPKVKNAMDIGTGAGFPGMILAFALEQTHFTLVEPLQKRASFLQFVKSDLKLDNVTVKNCRVEELEAKPYDLVTSRAVTQTNILLKLSRPFLKTGSLLLFYKGEKVFDEINSSLKHKIIKAKKRHYLLIES